ncbi:MAG: class I SAM-dependent methyltransferase [Dongiaceae bacterium]
MVDFGRTADDYARHRAGFPDRFFDRLRQAGVAPTDGAGRALDLGTGTGSLARGLAHRGWQVTGLDISLEMLAAARESSAAAGFAIDYRAGRAEATGLSAQCFDLVAAGTCWHWFDRPAAAREARRLLRTGGWLVIAALDWSLEPNGVLDRMWQMIARHNPRWRELGGSGLQFDWAEELPAAGFTMQDRFQFETAIAYSHEAWRGRARASTYVGASLPPDAIAAFDDEQGRLLAAPFPDAMLAVPHRVSAMVAGAE